MKTLLDRILLKKWSHSNDDRAHESMEGENAEDHSSSRGNSGDHMTSYSRSRWKKNNDDDDEVRKKHHDQGTAADRTRKNLQCKHVRKTFPRLSL